MTPSQTPQQEADDLLHIWRLQREIGIPANDRVFTIPEDAFERDLAIIRQVLERA